MIDYTKIPDYTLEAINAYVLTGRYVGDFLTAVICNNLSEAVARADDQNLANIRHIVGYFYNKCPGHCWGSKEKMNEWIKNGGAEGYAEASELKYIKSELLTPSY